MSKKSSVEKQKRRERLVKLSFEKRAALKAIVKSLQSSPEERFEAQMKLNKMSPNSSAVRLRNRCALTGRCRGFLRKFHLSRLCFRELASAGKIPGMQKASW